MSMGSRQEVVERLRRKYQGAGPGYRRNLINELCSVGGYERKYAIKVLNGNGRDRAGGAAAVADRATDRRPSDRGDLEAWGLPCGKRLVAMLPLWMPAYEQRHGVLPPPVRRNLHQVSAPTLDRLLAPRRLHLVKRLGGTKPGRLLRCQFPVRCESSDIDRPGYLEADTVDHGGDTMAGDFMRSIAYTDIYSGWTEQAAIWNKSAAAVLARNPPDRTRPAVPAAGLRCRQWRGIPQLCLVAVLSAAEPARAVHPQPRLPQERQRHVEQKNWTKVRLLLGYARYDQPELVDRVQRLYRHEWRLLQNLFQPIMKLHKKQRHGSRVQKTYDRAQTPAQRLLAWPGLSAEQRERLRQLQATLDPIALSEAVNRQLQQIRRQLREGRRYAA